VARFFVIAALISAAGCANHTYDVDNRLYAWWCLACWGFTNEHTTNTEKIDMVDKEGKKDMVK
jgi:hypothetical protein